MLDSKWSWRNEGFEGKKWRARPKLPHKHCTKNWIYTNLLGVNMVQKSANYGEIKSKDGKYRICLPVYMGVLSLEQIRYLPSLPFI